MMLKTTTVIGSVEVRLLKKINGSVSLYIPFDVSEHSVIYVLNGDGEVKSIIDIHTDCDEEESWVDMISCKEV